MNQLVRWSTLAPAVLLSLGLSAGAQAQQDGPEDMSFFVTSTGPGNGADLVASKARIAIASSWRRRRVRAAAPGAPI